MEQCTKEEEALLTAASSRYKEVYLKEKILVFGEARDEAFSSVQNATYEAKSQAVDDLYDSHEEVLAAKLDLVDEVETQFTSL